MDTWTFLDDLNVKVYCISLKTREDRFQASRAEFERVGLLPRVEYFRPDPDPISGRRGCWRSHIHIIHDCGNSGPVLIFEDDVVFLSDWKESVRRIKWFLLLKKYWDVLFLGGMIYDINFEYRHPDVFKARVLTTHAYFISQQFIRELRNDFDFHPDKYKSLTIDCYYLRAANDSFVLKKQCCGQNTSLGSDIDWPIPKSRALRKCTELVLSTIGWNALDVNNWFAMRIGILNPLRTLVQIAEFFGILA
jgi:hypothetical protein